MWSFVVYHVYRLAVHEELHSTTHVAKLIARKMQSPKCAASAGNKPMHIPFIALASLSILCMLTALG